eukprot:TRINITY_DN5906_c0_g1_i1.p1 TRINITY_DN5906_c0_g1~~TRINITY_DN5906_c0_g1_i1.p1  ORF type:complete len:328 (-),score=67.50 TRINITY_DN5906_c0_g1_i1:515-1498(-)
MTMQLFRRFHESACLLSRRFGSRRTFTTKSEAKQIETPLHPPVTREWTCQLYPDMKMQVCEWGSPTATHNILLLHGWMDSAASFYRMAPILSKSIRSSRIVSIDLPGHGFSSHPPLGSFYYFTDYIGDVHAFVANHLKWKRFDVIGHSMGGNIGMLLAASFPELVNSLAMLDIIGPMPTIPANQAVSQLRRGVLERSLALEHIERGPKLYASLDEAVDRLAASEWSSSMRRDSIQVLSQRQIRKAEFTNSKSGTSKSGYVFNHDPKLRASPPARLTEEQIYAYAAAIECPVFILSALAYKKFEQHDRKWVEKRLKSFRNASVLQMEV